MNSPSPSPSPREAVTMLPTAHQVAINAEIINAFKENPHGFVEKFIAGSRPDAIGVPQKVLDLLRLEIQKWVPEDAAAINPQSNFTNELIRQQSVLRDILNKVENDIKLNRPPTSADYARLASAAPGSGKSPRGTPMPTLTLERPIDMSAHLDLALARHAVQNCAVQEVETVGSTPTNPTPLPKIVTEASRSCSRT